MPYSFLRLTAALLGAVAMGACQTTTGSSAADDPAALPFERQLVLDMLGTTKATCGATYSLIDGDLSGSSAYVVSVFPEPERALRLDGFPDRKVLRDFARANGDLLRRPENTLGAFCERGGGSCVTGTGALVCYLDISRRTDNLPDAARLARACNQKAVAKLSPRGVEILESMDGAKFGDGAALSGVRLAACREARESVR